MGGGGLSSRGAWMEAIRALNLRLDRVSIENLDWEHCVELYDRPHTFSFLDSPYTDCDARMYASWTPTDVQRMRDRLGRLRGKWMVTLNDCAAVRAIFAGCKMRGVVRKRGIRSATGVPAPDYREVIITPE